jgi:thiosulfate/3-mercaptopyruvate sulfurtransferase
VTSALISAEDLLVLVDGQQDGRETPLLLDVRWTLAGPDHESYLDGHIPGAVFCDLDADVAAPPGEGGRHPLPSEQDLTAAMRRLGVAPGRDVVVYDGGNALAAARAWWTLRWAGHERVRVLDGGLPAWLSAGGTLEAGEVEPTPAPTAQAHVGAMPTVSVQELATADMDGAAGEHLLVDLRAVERFRGEQEPVDPVAGHIPGALSCPASSLLDEDGRYLTGDRLRAVLAPVLGGGRVVSYCGSGVQATQLVLALRELGVDAALYAGSWSEWIRDPDRPVATGS